MDHLANSGKDGSGKDGSGKDGSATDGAGGAGTNGLSPEALQALAAEMANKEAQLRDLQEKLAQAQAFAGIDPVAWQRDMRQDRELPGRNK